MNTENITLGDFVQQLLLQMGDYDFHFRDERPWHELFYDFKVAPKKQGKPQFLNSLFFDWNGAYPRCQELSDYLHGLHWTGCMSASNPTYDNFKLSQGVRDIWQTAQVDPDLQDFLAAAADTARNELAVGNAR